MSFYLLLEFKQSNYPGNKESNFTTVLDNPLHLDNSYEVAITEITYTNNWKVSLGKFSSKNIKEKEIIIHDKFSIDDLINYFQENINIITIGFTAHTRILKLTSNIVNESKFDSNLCKFFLNFPKPNEIVKSFSIRINPNFNIVKALHICTDIIDDQIINNKKEKIIKTIRVEGQVYDTIYKSFDTPNYVHVNKTYINTINIQIKDENLKELNFIKDKVKNTIIVKLHFRINKSKNEFLCNTTKRRIHGYFRK